jgi:hypothetical protein
MYTFKISVCLSTPNILQLTLLQVNKQEYFDIPLSFSRSPSTIHHDSSLLISTLFVTSSSGFHDTFRILRCFNLE